MKVILLQNVPKVGQKYDIKNVSDGYARNFLFPKKLAEIATDKTIKNVEVLKSAREAEMKIQRDLLAKNIEDLNGLTVEIKEKANEKGHLFASVNKDEIVSAVKRQTHLDITADLIQLKEPIKETGEYDIVVATGDNEGVFKLRIERI